MHDVMKVLERVQSGNLLLSWTGETDMTTNDVVIVNRYEGDMFRPDDFDLGDSRRPYGWGQLPGWP